MKLPIFSITGVTPLKPLLISITVSALSLERTAAKPDGIGSVISTVMHIVTKFSGRSGSVGLRN